MGGDWRDKAGGLMCVGLSSTSLDDRTRALLDVGVCGVLLRGAALTSAAAVADLVHAIKTYAQRPTFVAVDSEVAVRVSSTIGMSPLPFGPDLGRTGDVELARHVGEVLGRELRALGIDMTLGPCVDVTTRSESSLAGRSLGSDAELVGRLGAALIEGQQAQGVAACAKHFPGHGDSACDARLELPHLPHRIARLEEVELEPFRASVSARVAGVMVGHLLFDALDENAPASLSRPIVFGLLRQKMSYRGMVMVDDVDMRALSTHYKRDTIAKLGVASGADCFLCASRPETAFELIDAIERGVKSGAILPERIEAARRRIAPVLHRYVQGPKAEPDLSALGKVVFDLSTSPRILKRSS